MSNTKHKPKKSNTKNNNITNENSSANLSQNEKDTSIKELNAILKGEHMAINGYEKYIENITETNIKSELQKIQKEHKENAIKISERIQNLGGHPIDGVGLTGFVAETISNVKDIGNHNPKAFLQEAYKGESMGIKFASEIVKGDLDKDSMNLVNSMLATDNNHVTTLSTLINSTTQS